MDILSRFPRDRERPKTPLRWKTATKLRPTSLARSNPNKHQAIPWRSGRRHSKYQRKINLRQSWEGDPEIPLQAASGNELIVEIAFAKRQTLNWVNHHQRTIHWDRHNAYYINQKLNRIWWPFFNNWCHHFLKYIVNFFFFNVLLKLILKLDFCFLDV